MVGRPLLGKRLLQQLGAIGTPEFTRPGDQRAVAGDLIMLGCLGGGDQGDIHDHVIIDIIGDLVCLIQNAVDCRAIDGFGLDAKQLECFLQSFDMYSRLIEMALQSIFQIIVAGLVDYDWERFGDLLLGVIDGAQRMDKKIVQCLDIS